MAKKSKRVIDPMFSLPRGAEDQFSAAEVTRVPVADGGIGVGDAQMVQIGGQEDESTYYLATPESFIIFDQSLRRAPGGQQVVDIVIETEDVPGAAEYEVQIAKA